MLTGATPRAFARLLGVKLEGNELDALLQLTPRTERLGINARSYTGVAVVCLWRLFRFHASRVIIPSPSVADSAGIMVALRSIAAHAPPEIREALIFSDQWAAAYRDSVTGQSFINTVPYGFLDSTLLPNTPRLTVAFWDYDRAPGKAIRDALALANRRHDLVVLNHPHEV